MRGGSSPLPAEPAPDEIGRDAGEDQSQADQGFARGAEQRVQDDGNRGYGKRHGYDRVAPDAIGARELRLLAAQDNHRGGGGGVENPGGKNDVSLELLVGAARGEHHRPHALEDQRSGGRFKARVDSTHRREE